MKYDQQPSPISDKHALPYIMEFKLKNNIFFTHFFCSSTLKQETESKALQYNFCEMKEVMVYCINGAQENLRVQLGEEMKRFTSNII